MVTTSNKTVVFRKHPTEYPVAGEHLDIESRELVADLKENDVLSRNLFLSIDPCMDLEQLEKKRKKRIPLTLAFLSIST